MPRLLDVKPAIACLLFPQVDLELTHIDRGLVPVGMHRRFSMVQLLTLTLRAGGVLHIWCDGLRWPGAMRVSHPKAVEP